MSFCSLPVKANLIRFYLAADPVIAYSYRTIIPATLYFPDINLVRRATHLMISSILLNVSVSTKTAFFLLSSATTYSFLIASIFNAPSFGSAWFTYLNHSMPCRHRERHGGGPRCKNPITSHCYPCPARMRDLPY